MPRLGRPVNLAQLRGAYMVAYDELHPHPSFGPVTPDALARSRELLRSILRDDQRVLLDKANCIVIKADSGCEYQVFVTGHTPHSVRRIDPDGDYYSGCVYAPLARQFPYDDAAAKVLMILADEREFVRTTYWIGPYPSGVRLPDPQL